MGIYRTIEQAQAEYDAVRAAYLKALDGISYSASTGGGSLSVSRADPESLRRQMLALEAEIGRMGRGGPRVRGAVPID